LANIQPFKISEKSPLNTLKNAGLFQPKFGSNMDKTKCWVKNVINDKNVQLKVKVEVFNPTFGFVHILPNFGLKQPSIV